MTTKRYKIVKFLSGDSGTDSVNCVYFQACGAPKRDGKAGPQEPPDVGVRVARHRCAAESGMGALYDASARYVLHLTNKQVKYHLFTTYDGYSSLWYWDYL